MNATSAVICNRCRSNEAKEDLNPHEKNKNGGATINFSRSSSNMHENVGVQISLAQIGMIFGNIPFEPTLSIPIIFGHGKLQETMVGDHGKSQETEADGHGKSLEVKVKIEEYTGDDDEDWTTEFQHPFFSRGATKIQIKQEQGK